MFSSVVIDSNIMLEVIRGHAWWWWHVDVILILAVADWSAIVSGGWQHKTGFSVTVDNA